MASVDGLSTQNQEAVVSVIRAMVTSEGVRELANGVYAKEEAENYECYLNHLEKQHDFENQ